MSKTSSNKRWREENQSLWKSRIQCGCGSTYTYPNKAAHLKTQRHRYMCENESLRRQLIKQNPSDSDSFHTEYMKPPDNE